MVSTVFRPEMFHDYPQLFNEANREHLRVVATGGKVVCHVGFTERPASLSGCRIDVACIGAVATLPEQRGRGYASAAFQDACERAAADGVDVMLISGGRGLYTRVGCRAVGRDWGFSLTPQTALRLAALPGVAGTAHYTLAPAGPPQIGALRALYQREPVRFLRPLEDWEMAFQCGIVMNTAADFWALWDGAPAGGRPQGRAGGRRWPTWWCTSRTRCASASRTTLPWCGWWSSAGSARPWPGPSLASWRTTAPGA